MMKKSFIGCRLLLGLPLRLGVWIVDHALLDEPCHADGDGIGLIITGVFPFADELREGGGNLVLLGEAVAGDCLLDSLGTYLLKLTPAESPSVKVGNADHLMEDLDGIRVVVLRASFADDN